MTDAIQVYTTTAERSDAQRIATSLVAQRLAACVQVSGPLESTYRWKDKVETTSEWRCTIKTSSGRFAEVVEAIRQLHPYDEPEVIATPIVAGSPGYLKWLAEQVGPEEEGV